MADIQERPNQTEINDIGDVVEGIWLVLASDVPESMSPDDLLAFARELRDVALRYGLFSPLD